MQGTLRRQQNNHQRDETASHASPYQVPAADAVGDTVDYHQLSGVNNCLSQSPQFETANTISMANMAKCGNGGGGVGGNNLNNSSSNINSSSSSSGLDNKFSMNLIKFPHHHNNLFDAADDEHPHLYSNQQQQQQPQLSYSGLSEAMHNKNFKLDSDRTDISTSLAHFNAPLQHPAVLRHAGNNAALPLHHLHNHHHSRFDEMDEDGSDGGGGGLHLSGEGGDKKFNQLQELENSLLMQNLQSNFLKKLDSSSGSSSNGGYSSSSNPDYRSLNRRSGFIDAAAGNANNNYTQQYQQQLPTSGSTHQIPGPVTSSSSSSSGSSNPFQRMMGPPNAATNKGASAGPGTNNFHTMNPSNSSQSIRNTARSHIITDTLPGPESCV